LLTNGGMVYVLVALLVAGSGSVSTESRSVPTAENFAACNAEARDALKSGASDSTSASPITKDHQRADQARRGDGSRSEDPQLAGIDADGAKNPTYQAAYRTCMRKAGF
jgi:hypothetical protein